MEQLSRTVSTESSRSWTTPHLLASGSSSRKSRGSEPQTGAANIERASVSMPPPASDSIARHFPSRRASKASDSSTLDNVGSARDGPSAVEVDTTPTLEGARHHHGNFASAYTLTLPDSAFRPPRSEPDAESNRLSFSSLYSIGSAIYNTTRGLSGPSSLAGSEPEGKPL